MKCHNKIKLSHQSAQISDVCYDIQYIITKLKWHTKMRKSQYLYTKVGFSILTSKFDNKCKECLHNISYKNRVYWLSLLKLYDNNS